MPEYLVIRLHPDRDEDAVWLTVDEHGRRTGEPASGPLEQAAAAIGQRRVRVLVPGTEVLLTRQQLNIKNKNKLLQALPYALEEQIAEDVESLHFAATRPDADGEVLAGAVSRRCMDEWLQRLADAGLQPQALYSDTGSLPVNPGSLSVLLEDDRIHAVPPDGVPRVFEGLELPQILALSTAETATPPPHLLVHCQAHHNAALQDYWHELREDGWQVDVRLLPDAHAATQRMAAGAVARPGLNLLQGRYANDAPVAALLRPWRGVAALCVALGAVTLGVKTAEYVQLNREVDRLNREVATAYQEVFGSAAVSNYRLHMQQELARLRAGGTDAAFLETLTALSEALERAEQARILALSYRDGVTNLRLRAPNVGTLDDIQRGISARGGFRAEIQGANQLDGGLEGRLRLTRVRQ